MQIRDLARLAGVRNAPELDWNFAVSEPVGYSIDSRTIRPNEVFFAVKGEVFDGHDFVKAAFERGAAGAVVSRKVDGLSDEQEDKCLYVGDTLDAMQELARQLLAQWGRPIIGITGSMGKTTTKDLTANVLGLCGRAHRSAGNLNNTYGLPLTVLQMVSDGKRIDDFDYAVLEMGMSYAGEITRLCEIAPPRVAVVLNVAPVHLEHFPGIEGIAEAKAEIVRGMVKGGVAVLNLDDPFVRRMAGMCGEGPGKTGARVVFFGRSREATISAQNIRTLGLLGTEFTLVTPRGETRVHLPLPGEHFISSALVAAAVALNFNGMLDTIAVGLSLGVAAPHRGEILRFAERFTVVDDSYNSNPFALNEMMKLLADARDAGRRILVAGEMLELGPDSARMHADCGRRAAELKLDFLIGVRGDSEHFIKGAVEAGFPSENAVFVSDSEAAGEKLAELVQPGDAVLVKGSRGVKTEKAIEVLKHKFPLHDPSQTKSAWK